MKVPYKKVEGGVTIEVKVEPRSSKACIQDVSEGMLKIKLTSPPVGGEANGQLVKLLSKELGVKKSSIRIIRGERSKKKVIMIDGLEGLQEI